MDRVEYAALKLLPDPLRDIGSQFHPGVLMAITTRLYLSGVGAAFLLCAAAITFPEVPPPVMLGALGAVFLALAARTHRHAQALHADHVAIPTAVPSECQRDPAMTTP